MIPKDGPLTLQQLPSDAQLAAEEGGLTYRELYFRLWLQYLERLKELKAALEARS